MLIVTTKELFFSLPKRVGKGLKNLTICVLILSEPSGVDSYNISLFFLSPLHPCLSPEIQSEVTVRRKCSFLLLEPFHSLVLKPHLAIWVWERLQLFVDCSVKSHHWGLMLPFLSYLSVFESLGTGGWKVLQKRKENMLKGCEPLLLVSGGHSDQTGRRGGGGGGSQKIF